MITFLKTTPHTVLSILEEAFIRIEYSHFKGFEISWKTTAVNKKNRKKQYEKYKMINHKLKYKTKQKDLNFIELKLNFFNYYRLTTASEKYLKS